MPLSTFLIKGLPSNEPWIQRTSFQPEKLIRGNFFKKAARTWRDVVGITCV